MGKKAFTKIGEGAIVGETLTMDHIISIEGEIDEVVRSLHKSFDEKFKDETERNLKKAAIPHAMLRGAANVLVATYGYDEAALLLDATLRLIVRTGQQVQAEKVEEVKGKVRKRVSMELQ